MSKIPRFVTIVLLAFLLAGVPLSAGAAPAAWKFVDVTLQTEQQPLLLVSGELSGETPLPSQGELAVPAGSQLLWIGEVLGGAPSEDPTLQYVKTTVGATDIYTFTLSKSRVAQIEVAAPGMSTFDGTTYTSALTWTAWTDLAQVRIAERVPAGSQVIQPVEGATMQPGSPEFSYYAKIVQNAKAGDTLGLTYSYTVGSGAPASPAGSSSGIAIAVIAGAILLLGGLLVLALRRGPGTTESVGAPANARRDATAADAPRTASSRPAKGQPVAQPVATPARRIKPGMVMVGVMALAVVGFVAAVSGGTATQVAEGKITKDFGAANPCSSASIPVMAKAGVDLASDGKQIVEAFTGADGVGVVSLDVTNATLDVAFCSSSQSEESVRQILLGTGLIDVAAAPAASAPVTATVDAAGALQRARVDTATEAFDPQTVVLAAGIPAEIEFGPAAGCVTEVVISSLGVTQELGAVPVIVSLPALQPGTYAFACAMGHQTGSLVVQ